MTTSVSGATDLKVCASTLHGHFSSTKPYRDENCVPILFFLNSVLTSGVCELFYICSVAMAQIRLRKWLRKFTHSNGFSCSGNCDSGLSSDYTVEVTVLGNRYRCFTECINVSLSHFSYDGYLTAKPRETENRLKRKVELLTARCPRQLLAAITCRS